MTAELVPEVNLWKLRCPNGEFDLVCPGLNPSHVRERGLAPALRHAGLRSVTMHDLRHGYASMLVSAGVSIQVVQRLMGHATIQMTLNTYSHLLPGDDTGAAAVAAQVGGHVQRDRPASDSRRTSVDG